MKSVKLIFLFFVYFLVTTVFAIDNKIPQKINYDNFKKYWEESDFAIKYLENEIRNYNEYMTNTKFDRKFELKVKEQSLQYGTSNNQNILVIINQKLYNPLTMDDLDVYKNDLESEGYSVKIVTSTNSCDPKAFRDYLIQEWTNNNINGAFLIGGLPVSWYELPMYNEEHTDTTGWDLFPCDLYFMDLDGQWLDNERNNGIYDDHTGNVEPDIWVGRLYTPTMTYHNVNESELVERYLIKDHLYREGKLRLKNQGFSYVDKDWAGFHMENEVFKLYNDVTYVNDGINGSVTASDYRKRIKEATNNKYEWMYLAAHSSPTDHYFKDGLFNSKEIEALPVQVLFYLNFNCSAARYTDNDCLCNWYVMEEPYGLLSIGSTKGGSMIDQYDYYEPLSKGHTFGEAYKYWGVRHFEVRDWHYGLTCIGDPTLKLSRFMSKSGPRFCYAVSPQNFAKMDSTNPTFVWTKADSANKYILEIYKGSSTIWFSNYVSDTLLEVPEDLLKHGFKYKWRVKAYSDNDICVDFTQFREFRITKIDTNCVYLSDLDCSYYWQEWGNLGLDETCEGNTLSIAGQEYDKGLGTHANGIIRYELDGKYNRFSAIIGHDDESNCGDGLTFEVKLDSVSIFGPSKVFMHGDPPEQIELNIAEGNILELIVHAGENNWCDHADWAEAKVWNDSINDITKNNTGEKLINDPVLIDIYPNPFNSQTIISFKPPSKCPVSLVIYNLIGKKVKTLIDGQKLNGLQKLKWDGKDDFGNSVSSGIYFCRILSNKVRETKKIILIR